MNMLPVQKNRSYPLSEYQDVTYAAPPDGSCDPLRDDATRLLMERYRSQGGRLLIIEAGCGALAARFASDFLEIHCQNSLIQNHNASLQTLAGTPFKHVHCALSDIPQHADTDGKSWDEVIYRLGRGTAQLNAVLLEAFAMLPIGGSFVACGGNDEGIKSFEKRGSKIFGNVSILEIKSSCRMLKFQKEKAEPSAALEDPHYFEYWEQRLELPRGESIQYRTKPGIFSYRGTDTATQILAGHIPDCTGKAVLDLACGSGVLSLVAALRGSQDIICTDNSIIAVSCAQKNLLEHNARGEPVCTYFLTDLEMSFDIIISNPPFHVGAKTDFSILNRILEESHSHLKDGGSLYMVANQFLAYYQEAKKLFRESHTLSKEKGYIVYRMEK